MDSYIQYASSVFPQDIRNVEPRPPHAYCGVMVRPLVAHPFKQLYHLQSQGFKPPPPDGLFSATSRSSLKLLRFPKRLLLFHTYVILCLSSSVLPEKRPVRGGAMTQKGSTWGRGPTPGHRDLCITLGNFNLVP